MAELSKAQLLELVHTTQVTEGNSRVKALTQRIVTDLFKTIDDFDVSPDEFWAAADWLTRLGAGGQTGLITAGLGFDRLLDIRMDEADEKAARAAGTPRAIEGPLYIPGAPLSKGEVRLDEGEPKGEVTVAVKVTDEAGIEPIQCEFVWAWVPKEKPQA